MRWLVILFAVWTLTRGRFNSYVSLATTDNPNSGNVEKTKSETQPDTKPVIDV